MTTFASERTATRELTLEQQLSVTESLIGLLETTLSEFREPKARAELYKELSVANAHRHQLDAAVDAERERAEREAEEAAALAAAAEEQAYEDELEEELIVASDLSHEEALARLEGEGGPTVLLLEEASADEELTPEAEVQGEVDSMLAEARGEDVLAEQDEDFDLEAREEEAVLAAARALVADTHAEEMHELSDADILKRALGDS